MDIGMDNCFKATQKIKKENPNIRILILASTNNFQTVAAALSGGADAYILDTVGEKELIHIVKNTSVGYSVFDPKVSEIIRSRFCSDSSFDTRENIVFCYRNLV